MDRREALRTIAAATVAAPAVTTAAAADEGFEGGDGSLEDPYRVAAGAQLDRVRDDLEAHSELVDDVDLDGEAFVPIGEQEAPFKGTFHGNGREIRGLAVTLDRSEVGLFGRVRDAVLVDVHLSEADVTGLGDTGALLGHGHGVRIVGASASGAVTGTTAVGGLVGHNSGPIEASVAAVEVTGVDTVGGLAGFHDAGGLDRSYASGAVTGEANVGGLVGQNYADVVESYAVGEVAGSEWTGGVVATSFGTVGTCYWDVETTGQPSSAGLPDDNGLATAEMTGDRAVEHMEGFDFEEEWRTTDSYPELHPPEIPEGLFPTPMEAHAAEEAQSEDGDAPEVDTTEAGPSDDADGDDGMPGPGIPGALASLSVAGYLLARRIGGRD